MAVVAIRGAVRRTARANLLAVFIMIVGAGRVGSTVAKAALAAGHDVSVLDEDPLSHERLDEGQATSWEDSGGRSPSGTRSRSTRCSRAGSNRPTCSSPRPTATTPTWSSPRSP